MPATAMYDERSDNQREKKRNRDKSVIAEHNGITGRVRNGASTVGVIAKNRP